jgi:4-carboxymuconolactone decarboxylase
MSRLHRFRPDDLDGEQQRLYRSITEGPRARGGHFDLVDEEGSLAGPFNAFLLSPPLGDALQGLGAAVRYRTGLPDRLREMAVLVVAAHWDSEFERTAHEAVGRAVGLSEAELGAIREGGLPPLEDPVERAGVRLTRALVHDDVDDATWSACVPPLTERTVFELTTLVGYYATLALLLREFGD